MAILTCKQTCECISLQIFSKYPIQKSRDRTNPPDLPTLKAYPTPGVGGRFGIFSLKWREGMNLKVPGAILPLDCAILSTRAKTVRGVGTTPLRRTRVNVLSVRDLFSFCGSLNIAFVLSFPLEICVRLVEIYFVLNFTFFSKCWTLSAPWALDWVDMSRVTKPHCYHYYCR